MMCFRAYEYFKLAAERGHHKAKEYLGFGMLLGDHMNLDPEAAMAIFQELSAKGSPKGQLVSSLKFYIQKTKIFQCKNVYVFSHISLTCVLDAQKNRYETVLLSTHNICFA